MSYVIAGRSQTFLMTNGKFGNLWEPQDLKKIKVISKHKDGWELAEQKGGELLSWHRWLDEITQHWHERNERRKQHKKEQEKTAVWQVYPDGLVWKLVEGGEHMDCKLFVVFKPKRRLVSRNGWVLKIEGETNEIPCFYCYDHEHEMEAIELAYNVCEGGDA